MTPSNNCYEIIEHFEQYRPTAYAATADERRRGIWSIGWGHTEGVREGDTCTRAQAEAFLQTDVAVAANAVNRNVTVQLNQNQFDALTSLTFNIGATAFEESTALRRLNDGDFGGAALAMLWFDKQSGHVLAGLDTRRHMEVALFQKPV